VIKRDFLNWQIWERYPYVRKYFAVVHADLSRTNIRDIVKWLLIAPLIGILTGAVIVLEVVLILPGIWGHLLPRYYAHHWLIYESLLTRVVAGERVSAHHRPVNIVGYMLKESCTVATLKSVEDFASALG
jgi:hypothetical protein